MALDLTGLPDYVDQTRDELLKAVVAGAKSVSILDLQTGYKGPADIHIFDTDVVFQADTGCGRTPDGTTAITKRTLTPGPIKVEENMCTKDLNKKYTQHQIKAGSADNEIPFAQEYMDLKVKKINVASDKAIWQGDTLSGDDNLKQFDGLLKIIDAATVVTGNTSGATAISSANIIGLINDIYEAIPTEVLEAGNVAIMLGTDTFRLYTMALTAANLFHYDGKSAGMEIIIPGTEVKVIALGGLSGTNRIITGIIGTEGDFIVGVDLENEEESIEMWWSQDDKIMKFDTNWKMGTQIKFPAQIVEFTLV